MKADEKKAPYGYTMVGFPTNHTGGLWVKLDKALNKMKRRERCLSYSVHCVSFDG